MGFVLVFFIQYSAFIQLLLLGNMGTPSKTRSSLVLMFLHTVEKHPHDATCNMQGAEISFKNLSEFLSAMLRLQLFFLNNISAQRHKKRKNENGSSTSPIWR